MLSLAVLTIGIGFTFVIINNVKTLRKSMLNNTVMNTKLIGEYCISPLAFNDPRGAQEILSRLNSIPSVVDGYLYDSQNRFYAKFNTSGDSLAMPDFTKGSYYIFDNGFLYTCEPIIYKEVKYGTVYIKASTKALEAEIKNHLTNMVLLVSGLVILAFLLAFWFQRIIAEPILKLSGVMKKISIEDDYSIRLERQSNDEIGMLYDGFNNMLDQILNRETERDRANASLKLAKERAEEADKLKSAFLANMSHEIRTPMNAIVGFSELLSDPDIEFSKRIEYLTYVNKSSHTLLALVNDIIDLSKIEASQLTIHKAECNINKALEEIYSTFNEVKQSIYETDIDIRLKLPNEQITTITDSIRLKQVLTNLLSNAIKFTENGYVEFGCKIINQNSIEIFVKDTGIGLSNEQAKVIFDRFRKVNNANNMKLYRGAGLGLAISKSLVEMLGGKIGVKSKLGDGSTFYFTLPYQSIEKKDTALPESKKDENKYNWPDKTILIAEDEETNYKYLEAIIRKTNANVLWAQDGLKAVELVNNNSDISLILMDIKMPRMNGYEATKTIKKKVKIPVISQTAYAMAGERQKSIEAGCDDYIPKPISAKRLLNMMHKYLT